MIRRTFVAASTLAAAALALPGRAAAARVWRPGELEIHHIATGRGNAAFAIFPDGTSLLIDAGDANSPLNEMAPARPTAERRAGEWIARYVARALRATGRDGIDYALMTHLHGDHVGDVRPDLPATPYQPTGISDVARRLTIGTLIDRGFPAYDTPPLDRPTDANGVNYIAFARAYAAGGGRVERFVPGSTTQIRERDTARAAVTVRNLAVNGVVATPGCDPQPTFPAGAAVNENMCCAAIRLKYGPFAYYAGGDCTNNRFGDDAAWRDIESAVADACGPVDVASANHHGYHDACGPRFVRALRPHVAVIQAWHVTHPAISTLDTLTDPRNGPRDIFVTNSHPANRLVNARFARAVRSFDGHVVVRVAAGGASYTVDVVDHRDERGTVVATSGPYRSGG